MSQVQTRPSGRVGVLASSAWMALLLGFMWVLEGYDQATRNSLDAYGIHPRTDDGLWEVFTAPFLHGGWAHLVSNSVPLFVLGVVVLLDGWRRWIGTTLVVVLCSGGLVWLISPPGSVTLGASGIVFGWLTYLIVRGLYTRAPGQIAMGAVVLLFYGGILFGVLPRDDGISWQAHLGGAIGGLLAARSQRRRSVDARWQ